MEGKISEIRDMKEETLRRVRAALLNILEDTDEARKEAVYEKNKTAAIIENFTDGLIFLNTRDEIEIISPVALALFKKTKEETDGRNIFDLLCEAEASPICEALRGGTGKVKSLSRKEVMLREKVYLELTTVFLETESEEKGTLIIMHDVSREKLIESLKTEFVSIAAHQLRTPLSAIKWTTSMILDGDVGTINSEQKDFLEKIYESNERMVHLINDLLNVSRIEEGRFLYKQEPSQMEDLVKALISSSEELLNMKKIKFELETPETLLPKVYVDKEKISIVIQNLLENAVKYTQERGSIKISLKKTNSSILFKIKDSGVGIPKSQQNRMFSKFFRAENVVRMETEGTGLGLYTSKNIVEAHKGRIWFESEENKGTTFFVEIPYIKEKQEACIIK